MNSYYLSFILLFVFFKISDTSAQTCSRVSTLPTLCITTQSSVSSKDNYVNGTLQILGDEGTPGLYNGGIRIRGRGNSTWGFYKKPYRINLNNSFSPLGLPATAKNWVLLANHADKTLIRNAVAFEISKYLGLPFTPSYRFVDVVMNGNYIGSYLLTDHVDVRKHRVDVEEGSESVPGSFLVEMDGFAYSEPFYITTARNNTGTIKYPDVNSHSSPHTIYILNYLNEFETRLYSTTPSDGPGGYLEMADLTSLVNWYLACELTGNTDAFWTTYLHKRKSDDHFFFGPLWDFDIAFDNDERVGHAPYRLMADMGHYFAFQAWILEFRKDDVFMSAVKQRWNELLEAGFRDHILGRITTLSDHLVDSGSMEKNYELWEVLDTRIHYEVFLSETYQEHVDYLFDYMSHRIDWLDKEIRGLPSNYNYRIDNLQSGKAMTVAETGAGIIQKTFQDNADFKWRIEPIDNGFYRLRSVGHDLLLSEATDGTQLVLASDNPGDRRQQWRITEVDNGIYALIGRDRMSGVENRGGSSGEDNPIDGIRFTGSGHFQDWIGDTPSGRWTISMLEAALPITISEIKGTWSEKNTVQLSWSVSEYVNGSHFEVERFGKDGVMHAIGVVPPSKSGTGEYSWQDNNPLDDINYYRLKLVDNDGSFSYSSIISVKPEGIRRPLTVYPNPVTDRLFADMWVKDEGVVKIEVCNLAGFAVAESYETVSTGLNNLYVDTSGLPAGIYFLKTSHKEQTAVAKFIRVHR